MLRIAPILLAAIFTLAAFDVGYYVVGPLANGCAVGTEPGNC